MGREIAGVGTGKGWTIRRKIKTARMPLPAFEPFYIGLLANGPPDMPGRPLSSHLT